MNYLDVYFSRINYMGDSTAERIRSGGIRSFYKWLAESPHTVRNLVIERGIYFDGIILSYRDREEKKIMLLNVSNNTNLKIGDIMDWIQDDGSVEKWLIFQEEKKVNGTYKTFWIIRCNYLLKWIDTQGHLQQSWSYFVSSLDSKIKGNFRTWHNLITPQPNKYAEILMPRYPIERSTNFILENESWITIEYDHTSVPGVIYLSLTENKINTIYDDVINNIADTDELAQYILDVPEGVNQVFAPGAIINPVYTLVKNGLPCLPDESELLVAADSMKKVKVMDDQLVVADNADGEIHLLVTLKNYPSIQQPLTIYVDTSVQEFSVYIEGKERVVLDEKEKYILYTTPINYITDNKFYLYKLYLISRAEKEANPEKYDTDLYIFFDHPKSGDLLLYLYKIKNNADSTNLDDFSTQFEFEKDLGIIKNNNDNTCTLITNKRNKLGYIMLANAYLKNNIYNFAFKIIEVTPLW